MDTKQITFIEETEQAYISYRTYWGIPNKITRSAALGRIENPPTYEDYASLMRDLPGHELDLEVHVRVNNEWAVHDVDSIDEVKLLELAEIAARDRKKQRYLLLEFYSSGNHRFYSAIQFHEYRGLVVGAEISIDRTHRDHFDVRCDSDFNYFNGMWVPPDYETVPLNSRRKLPAVADDLDLMKYFREHNPRRQRSRWPQF